MDDVDALLVVAYRAVLAAARRTESVEGRHLQTATEIVVTRTSASQKKEGNNAMFNWSVSIHAHNHRSTRLPVLWTLGLQGDMADLASALCYYLQPLRTGTDVHCSVSYSCVPVNCATTGVLVLESSYWRANLVIDSWQCAGTTVTCHDIISCLEDEELESPCQQSSILFAVPMQE